MRRWLASAAVVALAACPATAPALEFGGFGVRAGRFDEPFGIAAWRATGDVYVLDTNNHRVERFSRDGVFELGWGWGVADGKTRALQVCRHTCFPGFAGSGGGELAFAEDVAVDNDPHSPAYGDLYVADIGNHRVEKYSPQGRFLAAYGRGVNLTARREHDSAHEDRCPVKPSDRCGAGVAGSGPGQFEFPVEGHVLAVDGHGSLYVGDRNRVEKFSPEGRYEMELPLVPQLSSRQGEVGGVSGLAVDERGDLFVIRNGVTGVREYDPRGRPLRIFDERPEPAYPEGPTPVVTVDDRGHAYIDEFAHNQHRIREYDQAGHELAVFDSGREDVLHGMAYNPVNHEIYVLDTNGNTDPPLAFARIIVPPQPSPFARLEALLDPNALLGW